MKALAWGLLALATLTACRPQDKSPTLVTVNGEAISAQALDLELRLAGPEAGSATLLLEGLVDQALILQEGRRLGVTLSQDALDAAEALARGGTDDETLSATLQERGATLKEWKGRLAQAALADEVVRQAVRSKVEVGRQEIQDYFWEHLPAFRRGEKRIFRQVFTEKRAKAQAALSELQLGARFEDVAKRRGEGPEAAQGGLVASGGRNQLPKELASILAKLKPGEHSDVVHSPWGWHILYLDSIEKERGDTLDQAAPKAHAKLLKDKEQVLFQLWLERLREQAKIEKLGTVPVASLTPKAEK